MKRVRARERENHFLCSCESFPKDLNKSDRIWKITFCPLRKRTLFRQSVPGVLLPLGLLLGVGPHPVHGLDVLVGVAPAAHLAGLQVALPVTLPVLQPPLRIPPAPARQEPAHHGPLVHLLRGARLLTEEYRLVPPVLKAADRGLVHLVPLVDDHALDLLDPDELRAHEVRRCELVQQLRQLVAEDVPLHAELAHQDDGWPGLRLAAPLRLGVRLEDLLQGRVVDAVHHPVAQLQLQGLGHPLVAPSACRLLLQLAQPLGPVLLELLVKVVEVVVVELVADHVCLRRRARPNLLRGLRRDHPPSLPLVPRGRIVLPQYREDSVRLLPVLELPLAAGGHGSVPRRQALVPPRLEVAHHVTARTVLHGVWVSRPSSP
mmetsp:Transcript_14211/g.40306  ORF Transcript_14211/g.40306 Transcript_14211/m.40306 type:complete len:375 (-) Transcript_14211:28-1152(-)